MKKIIIIAEYRSEIAHEILRSLKAEGFTDIRMAESLDEIYGILRPFADQPEKIGLIIINYRLPELRMDVICEDLSNSQNSYAVPFVILRDNDSGDPFSYSLDCDTNLIFKSSSCYDIREIILATNYLLTIQHERHIRHKHEERLIAELANKNMTEAKLKYIATHDELTGLSNRSNFDQQLRLIINKNKKLLRNGALACIDIDHFEMINDLEGFDVGNRLLVELSLLISKCIPESSLFSRFGQDEFYLYIDNNSQEFILKLIENIRKSIECHHFFNSGNLYGVTVSIGLCFFGHGTSISHPSEYILQARKSCDSAKNHGRNRIHQYNNDDFLIKERQEDIYWIPIILKALRDNLFVLMFQPVAQLDTGNVSHYEVLLRMRDNNNSYILPDKFIPTAERFGLIHSVDSWLIQEAIDCLAALPTYKSYISLTIKLSNIAFQDPDLLQTIREKLELTWIDANRLTFEISEKSFINNFDKTREFIVKISNLGCKFALDDFSGGFYSFIYLKSLPVDYVTIDGQFIRNFIHSHSDQSLVKSMVQIATDLGRRTIAKFIDDTETLMMLREIGVNFGQGSAFGKPLHNLLDGQNKTNLTLTSAGVSEQSGDNQQRHSGTESKYFGSLIRSPPID